MIQHILIGVIMIALSACGTDRPRSSSEVSDTLLKLIAEYQDGAVEVCEWNGKTVYSGQINAYDVSSFIYDKTGETIGECNYFAGLISPVCNELNLCDTVWRVKDNIWGQPVVDKYRLKRRLRD